MQLYPFTDPHESPSSMKVVSGEGCYVTDSEGKRYLDSVAGLWCASLGFSHERLIAAAHKQMQTLPYYHSFMGRNAQVTDELSEALLAKLPEGIKRVFFACSGSEAVDSAFKISIYYQNARGLTDKKKVIAREGAYHGSGVASAGLTSMDYCHEGFDLPNKNVLRISRPHYRANAHPGENEIDFSKRLAKELDVLIQQEDAGTISAFIGEPVLGAGGIMLPPDGYWQEIQNVLQRHDILLIADEIITGFGRTGSWFACNRYDIYPDMMTMAKQLSSAYFPVSALALSEKVADTIEAKAHKLGTLGHGFTYGGHPVGAAVALETLKIYEEMNLEKHVQALGAQLERELEKVRALTQVAEVRHVGLMAGIELQTPDGDVENAKKLTRLTGVEAKQRGVLFRIINNILAISPPYVISEAELSHVVDVLHDSIRAINTGNLSVTMEQ